MRRRGAIRTCPELQFCMHQQQQRGEPAKSRTFVHFLKIRLDRDRKPKKEDMSGEKTDKSPTTSFETVFPI
ncbi:hypothetical protein AOXY_G516 [Acipenser oxyrinchus oxyrinchus]|uniref:Uncharacterized protein n=1 Tax=Acipenser oxyrinchus oxyrinchus TaxID=40147 RepID=A0AAD8LUR7_ACIOX|nr:hypothetical protein AOXY_G516 [Acipenser oxyrinchus oxyrinchus]